MNSLSFQSAHTTCHPSDFMRLARCEPMKPAPPPMHTRRVGALSAIDAISLVRRPRGLFWVIFDLMSRPGTFQMLKQDKVVLARDRVASPCSRDMVPKGDDERTAPLLEPETPGAPRGTAASSRAPSYYSLAGIALLPLTALAPLVLYEIARGD